MNNNSKPEEESFIDKMKQRSLADRTEKIKNMQADISSEKTAGREHELDEKATKRANDEKDLSNI